jgi:hypothetical protein
VSEENDGGELTAEEWRSNSRGGGDAKLAQAMDAVANDLETA